MHPGVSSSLLERGGRTALPNFAIFGGAGTVGVELRACLERRGLPLASLSRLGGRHLETPEVTRGPRLFPISLVMGLFLAGAARAEGAGTPATPFVAHAPHGAGSSLGGLITLQAPASGPWQAITVAFSDGLTPSLDVVLFSDNPISSTITDGAAVSVASVDLGKVMGVVHITDCSSLGAPTLCQSEPQAVPAVVPGSGVVYAAVITRTAVTPGANDMTLTAWAPR
ncbi:MAG: hypothetical protein JOY66_19900 [Acetobacteraceae bacterium]|nr:hypothetical protein [Acetobacteraceae bacterium]